MHERDSLLRYMKKRVETQGVKSTLMCFQKGMSGREQKTEGEWFMNSLATMKGNQSGMNS